MKYICIDCRMMNNSGIGTYIKNVLPRIICNMNRIFFYLLGEENEIKPYLPEKLSFKYVIIPFSAKIFSLAEQISYFRLIPNNVDLLWIPNFNIPMFYNKTLLVTIHDVFHLAFPHLVGGRLKYCYARWLFYNIRYKCKHILTVSQFSKKEIHERLNIDSKYITSIHLGVDSYWFQDNKNSKSIHDKEYILFVGNVKPNKNLQSLINAYLLIKDNVEFDLIIVGKKDGFQTADKLIYNGYLEAEDRIIFTGFISDDMLKEYYASALMFVFPSLYEGFGLPVLESMASGCPVLSSNKASLPEIGQEYMIYFNPESPRDIADKIMQVYKNKHLRGKMSIEGKKYAKKFNWDECAIKTMTVLQDSLK